MIRVLFREFIIPIKSTIFNKRGINLETKREPLSQEQIN